MAKFQFDELVKAAGQGEGIYDHIKRKKVTEEEARQAILSSQFRFSITDGYLVENGGQFDYVFNFKEGTWERSDWRKGTPLKTNGTLAPQAREAFAKAVAFIYSLPQKQFVTNTKSTEINTDAYEREKYGPIKRLTRCELRMGEQFFRWVVEEDEDTPFRELYAALTDLRESVDGQGK